MRDDDESSLGLTEASLLVLSPPLVGDDSVATEKDLSLMDLDETRYSTKAAADSALRLLQRGYVADDDEDHINISSSSSANDVSWIAAATTEPRRYRKNLGTAFEQAEQPPPPAPPLNINNSKRINHSVSMDDASQQQFGMHGGKEVESESQQPTCHSRTISSNINNSTIAVFLRTRPSSDATNTMEIFVPTSSATTTNSSIDIRNGVVLPRHIRTRAPTTSNAMKFARGTTIAKEYEFTGVLGPHVSQQTVYEHTVQPLLKGLVPYEPWQQQQQPQSALAFVYGITNAGKTYTHMGCAATMDDTEWGLVPRTLRDLWQRVTHNNDNNHNGVAVRQELQLSYYEIYNEQQNDLLQQQQVSHNKNLYPWLSSFNTTSSSNNESLVRHTVTSLEDGLQQLFLAQKHRRSSANGINAVSSRSHAICEFTIVTARTTATTEASASTNNTTSASLWLVDLAGSERTKRTAGQRWQETVQINKSLMTLNRCLMALRQSSASSNGSNNNNKVQPPYRESKLTQLFGKHWTSHHSASRTVMIVNVNPSAHDFDETQHALTYASAARTVRVGGVINSSNDNNNNNSLEYGYDGHRRRRVARVAEPTISTTNNNVNNSQKVGSTSTRAGNVAGQCLQKIKAVVQKLSPKKKNPTDPRSKRMQVQQHEQPKRARVGNSPPDVKSSSSSSTTTKKDFHSAQVRCELLDEMDGQMQAMKLQSSSSSSLSPALDAAAAAAAAKAQETVAELLETVQECEDEMVRMRERHGHELARHQSKHERVLRDKNLQLQRQQVDLHQLEQKVQALTLDLAAAVRGQSSTNAYNDSHNKNVDHIQALQQQLKAKEESIAALQRRVAKLEQELTNQHFDSETQKASLRHDIEQLTAELHRSRTSNAVWQQRGDDNASTNENKYSNAAAVLQSQQPRSINSKTVLSDRKDAWNRQVPENCSDKRSSSGSSEWLPVTSSQSPGRSWMQS